MDKLVLEALKRVVEHHPEIVPFLNEKALKILDEGTELHQKIEPYEGDTNFSAFDPTITEEDIDRAIALWDELMPEYAGMLDAAVIGADDGE